MSEQDGKPYILPDPAEEGSARQGNSLGFDLEFSDGLAQVSLRDRKLAGGVVLERLRLEIPSVRFPFDVSGGAERFRHQRCRLLEMRLSLAEEDLESLLRGALDPARHGIREPRLSLAEGCGRLEGTFVSGEQATPFSLRFFVQSGAGLGIRVLLADIRFFGWVSEVPLMLAVRLAQALKPLSLRAVAPAVLELDPVSDLLRRLLPRHGWKIPDLTDARVLRAGIHRGRLLVVVRRPGLSAEAEPAVADEPTEILRQATSFAAQAEIFAEAERALAEGRLPVARALYLGRGSVEPAGELPARRLMEIALARPEHFADLEATVDDALRLQPGLVPALLARAVMLEKTGQARAAEAFRAVGEACAGRGERRDAVLALDRAAELWRSRDVEQAIACAERILALDPDHQPTLRRLLDLYSEAGRHYRAVRVGLRLLRLLAEPGEVAACHRRIGSLYLAHFDDPERARRHLEAALEYNPADLEALELLVRIQRDRGQAAHAAALLERVVELARQRQDPRCLQFRLEAARIWEEDLDDPAAALLQYQRVLEEQPDHLHSLYRAGALAARSGLWERAVEYLSRLLDLHQAGRPSPDEVITSSCLILGRGYLKLPGGATEARAFLDRAVELAPRDITVWNELEKLDREEQNHSDLLRVLEHKAELCDRPEEALGMVLEAARLAERAVADRGRAERLYRRVLELQPANEEALESLSLILREGRRSQELAELLERSAAGISDPHRAAQLWSELAKLRLAIDDEDGAVAALESALAREPGNARIRESLFLLLREPGREAAFVEQVGRLDAAVVDGNTLGALWQERAERQRVALHDAAGAFSSLQRALEFDPDRRPAWNLLAELAESAEQWPEARRALRRLMEFQEPVPPEESKALWKRLARVEHRLENREATIAALQELARLDPCDPSVDWLFELLRDENRFGDLAEAYQRRAMALSGEEAATFFTASAALLAEKLSRWDESAEAYRRAVDAAPESPAAPARLASLQRVLTGLQRFEAVAEVLRRRIERAAPRERPAMWLALGALREARLGDAPGAEECFGEALRGDPEYLPALLLLSRRAFERRDFEKVLELCGKALRVGAERGTLAGERRAAVALDAARAAWELERYPEARDRYWEYLECYAARQFQGATYESFERLELLLREVRDFDRLALLYRRWLGTGGTAERQAGLERSLALLLFDHLEQPEEAIRLLGQRVQASPQDQDAVRDYLRLLRESGRFETLAALLEEQADQAGDDRERLSRREELAEIYQLRLGRPQEAARHLRTLLQRGYTPARERLAAICRQEGWHAELIELLRDQADAVSDPSEAANLLLEAAQLSRDRLQDPSLARRCLERAWELSPRPEIALQLIELFGEGEEVERRLELLREAVQAAEDPEERRTCLLRYASLCGSRAEGRAEAIDALREAWDIHRDVSLAMQLQPLLEQAEDFAGVADLQEFLVDEAPDDAERAQRVHRLGLLYRDRLGSPERAEEAFAQATRWDPKAPEHWRELCALQWQRQAWKDFLGSSEALAELLESGRERGELLGRMALARLRSGQIWEEVRALAERASGEGDSADALWSELAQVAEQLERPADAAEALEALLQRNPPLQTGLLRRLLSLRLRASDDAGAVSACERLLDREPLDAAAVATLQNLYRRLGRHRELARLLSEQAERLAGDEAATAWLEAAASLDRAGDGAGAEQLLRRGLSLLPQHPGLQQRRIVLLRRLQALDELEEWLPQLPDAVLQQEEARGAVEELWQARRDQGDDEHRLARCRLVLRSLPEHAPALQLAAELSESLGQAEEAELYWQRLEPVVQEPDPALREKLDLKLAALDFARGRPEEAEQRLRRCLESRPDHPEARSLLHKIFTGARRFADQVELLLSEADRTVDPNERVEKWLLAAGLLERELGDPQGAIRVLRRVVGADPGSVDAWRRLAQLYRLVDEPANQHEAWLRIARLAPDSERLAALQKAARLAEEVLRDPLAARSTWESLLELDPRQREALDRLVELDRSEGRLEELADHLERRADLEDDPMRRRAWLWELAEVLGAGLGQERAAVAVLRRILEQDPDDNRCLDRLQQYLEKLEEWRSALDVSRRRLERAGSDGERLELLLHQAELHQARLQDVEGAIGVLRRAAALAADDPRPLKRLRALAARRKDDALLAEIYEEQSAREVAPDARRGWLRQAGLLWAGAARPKEAQQAFLRVLELFPEDAVSRMFLARLMGEDSATLPHLRWLLAHAELLPPQLEAQLLRRRLRLETELDLLERIGLLERLLRLAAADTAAWEELIRLYRRTSQRPALMTALARLAALQTGPAAADLWRERAELLLADGRVSEAAEALARAAAGEGEGAFGAAVKLAELRERTLRDPAGALQALEHALRLRADDAELLRWVFRLAAEEQRSETAMAAAERLASLATVPAEQAEWRTRQGQLLRDAGRLEEARASFEAALSLDPACALAQQGLEALLSERPEALWDFYLRRADQDGEGAQRVEWLLRAARLLEPADPRRAREVLQRVLSIDNGSAEAHERLARLLAQDGQWDELLQVLYRFRERVTETPRRVAIAFEMGEICREHLNDPVRAAVHFEYCLNIDPEHAGALEELAEIRYQQKSLPEAARLYRRLGERGLAAKRFLTAFRLGEAAEADGDSSEAREQYRRAIACNPTFLPARQNLCRLLEQEGDLEALASEIRDMISILPEEGFETLALELWRELGRTQRRMLRFEEAARCFHEVARRDPADREAVARLKDFYANRMRWEEAVAWARRELELDPRAEEAPQRWAFLGDLYAAKLKDSTRAEEAYRAALTLSPDNLEYRLALFDLLRQREAWAELRSEGAVLLQSPLDPAREAAMRQVLGRACLLQGERAEALEHLERVLALGRADQGLVQEIMELARAEGRHQRYASLYGQLLEWRIGAGLPVDEAVRLYRELAQIYWQNLHDLDRATACLRRALELKPRDAELLRALGTMYASDFESCQAALEVFEQLREMEPLRVDHFRALARLEWARGERDRSLWYFGGVRFLAPVDAEARRLISAASRSLRPARPLNRGEWDEIVLHPAANNLLQRVMAVLAPYLEQLFPANLERFGVKGDDLVDRHNFPEVYQAVEYAQNLVSGRALNVFVIAQGGYQAYLDCGGTPALLVPHAVVERSTGPELTFFLAREVAAIAMGCVLPLRFSPADRMQLLTLLCHLANPDAPPLAPLPATAPQYLQAIRQVTPPEILEMLSPLLRRLSLELSPAGVERWLQGVRHTAARVALIACGDLNAAMAVSARGSEAAGGRELAFIPDRALLLERDPAMRELFDFAFSPSFLRLRQALAEEGRPHKKSAPPKP